MGGKDLGKAEEGIFKDFPDVNVRRAVVDVSKSAEVIKWIEDVRLEFGELNGYVNNAGMLSYLPYLQAYSCGSLKLLKFS